MTRRTHRRCRLLLLLRRPSPTSFLLLLIIIIILLLLLLLLMLLLFHVFSRPPGALHDAGDKRIDPLLPEFVQRSLCQHDSVLVTSVTVGGNDGRGWRHGELLAHEITLLHELRERRLGVTKLWMRVVIRAHPEG